MRVRRTLVRLALALALASCAAAPAAASAAASAQSEQPAEERPLPADSIVVEVRVHDDGSATFQVQYEYRLDDANRTRGFQRLERRIEDSEAYDQRVRRDFEQTVGVAENETGREMAVRNVSVYARPHPIIEDYARVVHGFTWEGFAAVDGTQLRIGDALSGFWLPPHGELVLRWPDGYRAVDVAPSPDARDGREATWRTPEFEPDEPHVVLDASTDSAGGPDVALSGLALVALLLVLVAAVRYGPWATGSLDDLPLPGAVRAAIGVDPALAGGERASRDGSGASGDRGASADRRAGGAEPASQAGSGDPTARDAGEPGVAAGESELIAGDADGEAFEEDVDAASADDAAAPRPADGATEADPSVEAGSAGNPDDDTGSDDAEAGGQQGGSDASTDPVDDGAARAPLTNEEQLRQVLDSHDGRVKQQRVAEATGWSDSKTSRVVRSLEEEGAVDVYRIGRENVVCYPEVDALNV